MVFVSMLCKQSLLAQTLGLFIALSSVGCAGNKNKDVAETPAAAPPPAAYPDSPTGYPDSSGNSATNAPANNYGAVNTAPNAPSQAGSTATFQLRSGEQLISHQIKRGDTLGGLAKHYNTSQNRIMAANGMTSDKIYAGKTLRIPTSAPPADLAMNGAGAGASTAVAGSYPSQAAPRYSAPSSSPYSAPGSSPYSAPSASPYSPPVSAPSTYGSGGYGTPNSSGSYPSPTSAPAPPATGPYPQTQSGYSTVPPAPPTVPVSPSSTSFSRVPSAPIPPSSGPAFPTPNLSR